MAEGGAVTGIIPEFLMGMEASRDELSKLDELIATADMHERKHAMFERADAFVALPGGIGTLEELVEMLTWAQLRRHARPVAVLDVGGFWQPLSELLDRMEGAGFLHNAAAARPTIYDDVAGLVAGLGRAKADQE